MVKSLVGLDGQNLQQEINPDDLHSLLPLPPTEKKTKKNKALQNLWRTKAECIMFAPHVSRIQQRVSMNASKLII